ncbi:Erythromycin esterase [Abortiporus biennis]
MPVVEPKKISVLNKHLRPLSFNRSAYDPLLHAIGNAQVVLIGDGSHGTYEFYAHRANITQRLVEEKGFTAIAVEADWPDAFRVNRYLHGGKMKDETIHSARSSLAEFERFPKWMWKNEVMPPFIEYLKSYNDTIMKETNDPTRKVSFYGMDLYSLHRSAEEVLKYLERVDPEGAKKARKRYNCFERFGQDTMRYAYETQFNLAKDCHQEVLLNLRTLLRNHHQYIQDHFPNNDRSAYHPAEEQFVAEMNALVVRDAEEYYRTMMTQDVKSWNLRDDHFARTLLEITRYLGVTDPEGAILKEAKIVVWAHNSHIGDARATDMGGRRGEINVGQRCRELFGNDNVFNIGFLTNRGTVTAAYEWDEPPELFRMNPPIEQSIESEFDKATDNDSFVITHNIENTAEGYPKKVEISSELSDFLDKPRYQRFIGVIYRSATEIPSHYSKCSVAQQYDAVMHIKNSRGIEPLEPEDTWKGLKHVDFDETFPFGE